MFHLNFTINIFQPNYDGQLLYYIVPGQVTLKLFAYVYILLSVTDNHPTCISSRDIVCSGEIPGVITVR